MSKRDRASDPDDERLETDFEPFDEQRQRSRMARELKIGMTVIFALVVVLAVVLYNRLSPAKESPAASAEGQSESLPEAPKFNPGSPEPESPPSAWSPPTIVPALAGPQDPSLAGPGPHVDAGSAAAEESRAATSNLDVKTLLSPPAPAPKLPSAAPADRYAGYRGASQAGAATTAGQVEASPGVEARPTGETRDPVQGSPSIASGSGAGQAAAPSALGSGGLHLPSTEVNLATPPSFDAVSQSRPASTPEPNPLRTLGSAADPIGQRGPAPGPDATSQFAQPPEAFQGDARQAPMPALGANPTPSYRVAPQPSDVNRQDDVSGSGSGQSAAGLGRQSEATSLAGQSSQQWAPGANAVQSDPTRPALVSRDPLPSGAGQRDAGAIGSGQQGTYVVQPNDNYWRICEKLYGTGAYFRALAQHNRAKIPDEHNLQLGDVVSAPDASELHKAYPDLCPEPVHLDAAQRRSLAGARQTPTGAGRVYVVQEGDNLFDIARCELGKPTRWTEIVDLNREALGPGLADLNYLTPGMKLILPNEQPAGQLSRRPGSLYQR